MFKTVVFQLHWLLGITAGLVLSVMGVTGALMSFENEIVQLANPAIAQLAVRHAAGERALPVNVLLQRLDLLPRDAGKQQAVTRMLIDPTGARPSNARLAGKGGRRVYFDPYTGERVAPPRLSGAFAFIEDLHRDLTAGKRGQAVTGACTLILVFFCASGLYLRWPRRWWSLRTWWVVEWRRQGRSFLWSLHAVFGTWCLLVYLLVALTGLTWSYEWYRDGMVALLGKEPAMRGDGGDHRPATVDFARVQCTLDGIPGTHHAALDLRVPTRAGQPMSVRFLPDRPDHDRAYDNLEIDAASGALLRRQDYAQLPRGQQWLVSMFPLHTGSFFGLPGRIVVMLASIGMSVFFISGWMLYLDRRRKKRALRAARVVLQSAPPASQAEPWLIAFASQSGFAERLAWQAAGHLQAAGLPVQVRALAQVDAQQLQATRRALLVISTFGDGEPPDAARVFERELLRQRIALPQLAYAVLALGDRQYAQFCGFSRRIEQWLDAQGARALFPAVEMDNADPQALAQWHAQLAQIAGAPVAAVALTRPRLTQWTLSSRTHLNPGSEGAPIWRIDLQPSLAAHWQAGDILEVQPAHAEAQVRACLAGWGLSPDALVHVDAQLLLLHQAAAERVLPLTPATPPVPCPDPQAWLDACDWLPTRDYSLASVPSDGVATAVVRLTTRSDGSPGLGSGWLICHAPMGAGVRARLRTNPGFHRVDAAPMVLIGNGTGIAGLRALLREAELAGVHGHWLLFGERHAAHDRLLADELQGWQASGHLQQLDWVFSRDQPHKRYVQHHLRDAGDALRHWIDRGAVIYVCGSLDSMAREVDATLRELLGDTRVDTLTAAGRYRRDVY
ncbi:PepSY domain-containing protein [Xanthomonas vesicatoria]|uniref:PepSY domain-containing protein n=1 Tax=Xanthomonas vesicatoria TaxID=56460 RepID=UPI000731FA95|nr:sulfite reductase flavoprotein subunit alpha [Xanthomonas vesicatoria]KTF38432.1 iron-uptake factor [Xanthomonas vesicatoria]MCC8560076.1 sulfite reductase flavoprotein subunit alpha [Xanthomonas vesicatoria]MCC8602538.1 sulfite reductase flavoprotein subunit alpha [Xanthomonas vesicatoria]MCC8611043.1 sulfite reductase flavoprotein subunit alpha [Xanthomonas vesicatoria]MCC8675210.1 sulfite reductase flavoprotein subunit alpha [Xanthomonas vesicatoria]